ncbi:uncharacterized [Tachysurus ichikawai]
MPVAHEGQFGMAMGQEQNIWLASRNASGVDNMALQLVGLSYAAVQRTDNMPGRGDGTAWFASQVDSWCNGCQNKALRWLSLEIEHLVQLPSIDLI